MKLFNATDKICRAPRRDAKWLHGRSKLVSAEQTSYLPAEQRLKEKKKSLKDNIYTDQCKEITMCTHTCWQYIIFLAPKIGST